MFEHWPERRRRWFLVAFAATAWLLFSNAVAYLGGSFEKGGVGPDAAHAASLIGVAAVWVLVFTAFKLQLRHYLFAVLFGAGLTSLLVEVGFERHFASGIWALACDAGEGTACHNLADYYDEGASPIGGSLDSGPLHRRACALGGPDTRASCHVARSLGLAHGGEARRDDVFDLCASGVRSACLDAGRQLESAGRLDAAYDHYAAACRLARVGDAVEGCMTLLDSGFHRRRLQACETIEAVCATSRARQCLVAARRCERARSPHAGTSP